MNIVRLVTILASCAALSGCAGNHYSLGDRVAIGGGIGLGVGAIAGTAPGAIAGAVIGGAVGAASTLVY